MFNVEHVGRKVSELRKLKNMTQMELADMLNISFQAVSNWERGNSMPDISKLPELARLFEVSIDELLGENSELLENIANNNAGEYLKNNEVNKEEFKQVAPLLKPEQANMVFENAKHALDMMDIVEIAPFISQRVVDGIFLKAVEEGNYGTLVKLAPFAGKSVISEIALKYEDTGNYELFKELLPFVDGNTNIKVVRKRAGENKSIKGIAPFVDKSVVSELALKFEENGEYELFKELLPFIDGNTIGIIVNKRLNENKSIKDIAPFIDRNTLSEYFREKFL